MNTVCSSLRDAKRTARAYKRRNPRGKYVVRPYALGDRVAYQVVDVNRYAEKGD